VSFPARRCPSTECQTHHIVNVAEGIDAAGELGSKSRDPSLTSRR
jgi:hypothetical protein